MRHILFQELESFTKAVDEVIASSKYIHLQDQERIWDKILKAIEKFFEGSPRENYTPIKQSPPILGSLLWTVLIIGLILLLYYYMARVKKGKNLEKKTLYGEVIHENTQHQSLFDKAAAFEKDGNYKEAIRLYFISTLVYMNEKSLFFLDESKTNGEIIKDLKRKAFKGLELFRSIGDYFYYIWYGDKEVNEEKLLWYKEKVKGLFMEVENYHGE